MARIEFSVARVRRRVRTGVLRAFSTTRVEAWPEADERVPFGRPVDAGQRGTRILQRPVRLDLVGAGKRARIADEEPRRNDRQRRPVLVDCAGGLGERDGPADRIARLDERGAVGDAGVLRRLLSRLGGDREEDADRQTPGRHDRTCPT